MLACKSRNRHRGASSPLAVALTLSLCAQTFLVGPAQALSFIAAKKSQLQTPMESKLDDEADSVGDTASGDAPEASAPVAPALEEKTEAKKDTKSKKNTKTASKDSSKETAKASKDSSKDASAKVDENSLAPLTLNGDTKGGSDKGEGGNESEGESGNNYMKLHAETMGVAPKGPLDGDGDSEPTTLPSKSLKAELGAGKGKLTDKAKNVNVMPLSLQDSEAESDQKSITELECEKAQISDLWESTLNRNQDIQFVVQKLMPSSDKGRTTTMLMRLIACAVSAGGTGVAMMAPTPMGYAGTQAASSAIMSVFSQFDQHQQKRASIDQGQAISLYKMVRETADKVTENYRDYKKFIRKIDRAEKRTEKLQNMIADARSGQDAAKQIEMEYWVDKSKGDVEEAVADARRYRQSLLDLAGGDAVNKLDQALKDQLIAEMNGGQDNGPLLPGQREVEVSADAKVNAKPKYSEAQQQAFYKLLETQGGVKQLAAPDGSVPQ